VHAGLEEGGFVSAAFGDEYCDRGSDHKDMTCLDVPSSQDTARTTKCESWEYTYATKQGAGRSYTLGRYLNKSSRYFLQVVRWSFRQLCIIRWATVE
jgi:hypothetical protein